MIHKTWTVVRFGLIGLGVMGVITVPWSLLAVVNLRLSPHVPWAIPITLIYLAVVVVYLAGRGGRVSTTGAFVLIHAARGFAALAYYSPFYVAAGVVYGLLAYLTQSIIPSFLLHFLGDTAAFALRTSLVRVSSPDGRGAAFCLALALIAVVVSVAAFRHLAGITAPTRLHAVRQMTAEAFRSINVPWSVVIVLMLLGTPVISASAPWLESGTVPPLEGTTLSGELSALPRDSQGHPGSVNCYERPRLRQHGGAAMNILKRETAPRYRRSEGITSFLLASPRTCGAGHLTTTLVEIEPGGRQRIHQHAPEQVYFILAGTGEMTVADESRTVAPGDCVFVPSGSSHGIVNRGEGVLRYFSAAAPAFASEDLTALWPMTSEFDEQRATS
jgi:mannose-6-phosphate isomerase-like protein (cupin superfamily)